MDLTIKEQLEVLKNINWKYVIRHEYGLCGAIQESIWQLHCICISYTDLYKAIPLFTRQNALKFNADPIHLTWWEKNSKGTAYRKEFIMWIIAELRKQL